nr:hypothetical protein [Burkholderia vietnamiensis]
MLLDMFPDIPLRMRSINAVGAALDELPWHDDGDVDPEGDTGYGTCHIDASLSARSDAPDRIGGGDAPKNRIYPGVEIRLRNPVAGQRVHAVACDVDRAGSQTLTDVRMDRSRDFHRIALKIKLNMQVPGGSGFSPG